MTEADLDQKRTEPQNLLTGPLTPAAKADALYSISEINGIISSAHTGEKLEPVLLAVDLGLALLTAGESVLGKFALRSVGELVEVVVANRAATGLISGEIKVVGTGAAAANDVSFGVNSVIPYGTALSEEIAALGRMSAANTSPSGTISNARISLKPYVVSVKDTADWT